MMQQRGTKKILSGMVISDAPEKTVIVNVERKIQHPRYKKMVRKSKKFMAHDENNSCGVGDTVRIIESRPLSARKRWRVLEITQKAK